MSLHGVSHRGHANLYIIPALVQVHVLLKRPLPNVLTYNPQPEMCSTSWPMNPHM